MKTKKKMSKKLLVTSLLAGLLSLGVWTAQAGTWASGVLSAPGSFAAGATNGVTLSTNAGPVINLQPGVPLILQPQFAGSVNSGTSNQVFGLDLSDASGTYFSTTTPLLVTNAANGTNAVTGFIVIPASAFQGAKQARWDTYYNAATAGASLQTNTPTGLIWSQYY